MQGNDPFSLFAPAITPVIPPPTQIPEPIETPTRRPGSQRALLVDLELDTRGGEIREAANEASVVDLLSRHEAILVQSRKTSKVWDRAFLLLRQLLDGSILDVNDVDTRWYASASKRAPLIVPHYSDFQQMISSVDSALSYIEEMLPCGFWYPKMHNGTRERVTLADFLWSLTRSGTGWSPYLQLVSTDLVTPRMLRDSLPKRVVSIGMDILSSSWFYPSMTRKQEVCFWQHLRMLMDWFRIHREALYPICTENQLVFGKFSGFLAVILDANKQLQCIGPYFIGPWTEKWEPLLRWLETDRHCRLPRSLL